MCNDSLTINIFIYYFERRDCIPYNLSRKAVSGYLSSDPKHYKSFILVQMNFVSKIFGIILLGLIFQGHHFVFAHKLMVMLLGGIS